MVTMAAAAPRPPRRVSTDAGAGGGEETGTGGPWNPVQASQSEDLDHDSSGGCSLAVFIVTVVRLGWVLSGTLSTWSWVVVLVGTPLASFKVKTVMLAATVSLGSPYSSRTVIAVVAGW